MTRPATTCPNCGARMRLSKVVPYGSFLSKRRKCPECQHADRVLVREEVVRIIEVEERVRMRTSQQTQTAPDGE